MNRIPPIHDRQRGAALANLSLAQERVIEAYRDLARAWRTGGTMARVRAEQRVRAAEADLAQAHGRLAELEEQTPLEERIPASPGEVEQRRRSFAYGNLALSNPSTSREVVDRVAKEMEPVRSIERCPKPLIGGRLDREDDDPRCTLPEGHAGACSFLA